MSETQHVFISYIRENEEIVDRLCKVLESHGIKVWLDRNDIDPGSRWKQAIRKAIREGAFFLACFSKEYNKRDKTYMNEELTVAIEELRQRSTDRIWFIPVKLNGCKIPDRHIGGSETLKDDIQHVKLYKDWEAGIQSIVRVIQSKSSELMDGGSHNSKFSEKFTDQHNISPKNLQSNISQNRELTDWVLQQANDLMVRGEIDKALKGYSHGIDLDPYRPIAYNNRGTAHNIKGDVDNAIKDYNTAIELLPSDANFYSNRGCSQRKRCC